MKKTLLFLVGALMSAYGHSQSQPTVLQDWKASAGSQHFFYKNVTRTDGSGNVFVAGATQTAVGDYDILLAKFNSSGVQQWIRQIDGLAHAQDFATSIQLDGSGNIYIAGAITNDSVSNFSDLIVVKYNSSGTEQWRGTYDGANLYDCGTDIFVAANGTVVVTGSSYNSSVNLDFVSLSYSSSGVQQFATRFNHTSNMNDVPVRIIKSGSSIYISGAVQTGTASYDWAEVKYNTSGVQQAVKISTGGTTGIEEVHAMVQDASGNLYLAGITPTLTHGYDYDIIKMDSSLNILWEQTYDGADHLNDIANGIQVSASGDVYVTGASRTASAGDDYLTLKYNSSGSLIWSRTFNDSLNGNDVASAIVMDNSGKLVITGSAQTDLNNLDYYTLKYDTAGTVVWSIYYDGDMHLNDRATNLAIDTVGAIVVTGSSETAAGVYEYATVRYVEKDVITPTDFNGEEANNTFLFYENKGQLTASDYTTLVPRVRYYTDFTKEALFIQNDTLSILFSKIDTIGGTHDTLQKVNLSFDNCNEHLKVYPLEQQGKYLNFFLGHCPQGLTKIHGNQRLIVPEIYDNIDLMYYSNSGGFKYYFIVKPGGDPDDIRMQYNGATSTGISSNILTLSTAVGSVSYKQPFIYQLDALNDTVAGSGALANWQNNTGDNYSIAVHPYDSTKTLILEVAEDVLSCTPQNSFKNIRLSTYYGGSNHDQIEGMAVDTAGNVFYVGFAYGNTYPTTAGALYPTSGAVYNGILSQFNSFGHQNYATYFGGTGGSTFLYGVTANLNGEPTLVGSTGSTNFPSIHSGSQYTQTAGGSDACIARIRQDGAFVQWSTVFGGTGYGEQFNRVIQNGSETYAVGKGNELTPHITKTGAYNSPTTPSGNKGVIAHFNGNDSLVWSTFIGLEVRDIDNAGSTIGIGGNIKSSNLPYTHTAGTYVDSTFGGGTVEDAFFAIFNANDNIDWATYYGGTAEDRCNAVKFQNVEGVISLFTAGLTASNAAAGFTTYNPGGGAYYNGTFHGGGDAYFCKFSATGQRLWATYYGTGTQASHSEFATGIATDRYNNVYFSGQTNSQLENMPFLSGASAWYAQNYTNTNSDYQAFVFGVNHALAPFWATNFGGLISEYCEDMVIDTKNDYLYITGLTLTNSNAIGFPAYKPASFTGGWYSCQTFSPAEDDGYFAQFKIADAVLAGITENNKPTETSLITYPNPFTNEITFNFDAENSRDYSIQVYNTLGQLVYLSNEKASTEIVSKTIELPVNKGLYYVQIKLLNRTLAGKIIKQ
ncbi:MAG: hypothetical protein JWO44_1979 [Bacteroidetes bacterium]|nr:hypothetical protein [Bacteroidota bacterium]